MAKGLSLDGPGGRAQNPRCSVDPSLFLGDTPVMLGRSKTRFTASANLTESAPTPTDRLMPQMPWAVAGNRNVLSGLAVALTVGATYLVNPYSILLYGYYLLLWGGFVYFAHREQLRDFAFAYFINSLAIAIFFVIQTTVYPESYGTTSPLGSWTDDSFFFALAADSVPSSLELRQSYNLYSQPFSTLVRILTVLPTHHPMDVIFFQSGTAALLATFTKRFLWRMSTDRKLANAAYVLAITCPFLMMNGGVIFIRDTLAAALLIYTLSCLFDRRFMLAGGAVLLELLIRPGTGIILLPAIALIYLSSQRIVSQRNMLALVLSVPLVAVILLRATAIGDLLPGYSAAIDQVGLSGRQVFTDLRADAGSNALFLSLQEQPFLVKFILNGCYMFAYPFLDPVEPFSTPYFDLRSVVMGIVAPVYAFWLNGWFIAGAITRVRAMERQYQVLWAMILTLLIVGTYSLQTRHKTIIYPLYFIIIAIGMLRARPLDRQIGYSVSFALVLLQLAISLN